MIMRMNWPAGKDLAIIVRACRKADSKSIVSWENGRDAHGCRVQWNVVTVVSMECCEGEGNGGKGVGF